MADRSISIALEAKVQGFVSGMRTAQQATTDFANRTAAFARDNEQNLDRVGKAGMVFGGALLAGVGLAVKSFMEFDSAMSEVQASTHETEANMDRLREAAINAGADTSFSAKEAAQGIDELAKAGVSTKDVLAGGLSGALSLAAAGSLGVGEAAEIAASALTQFKLSGEDIPHLADLLAAGAGKAQGSVQDMGAALNQTGLVASSTGLTIEETTGALAAFASAGLTGSDAGTSFKTMLMSLNPNSAAAATLMEELGIKAYDAEGSFIGMSEYAGVLQGALKGMGDEQRNATLKTLFGSDAVRAANVLYEQGAAGIEKWEEAVNDAGFAAVTASIKQDNLAGDIEKLGGSFDSLLIKSGGGLAESLRGLVQGAEDLVDAFGKVPTPILNAGAGIAGIAGVALLAGGGLMTALPKVMEFKQSMSDLADASPRAAAGVGKVAKAAGLAAAAMVALQSAGALFTENEITSAEDYGQAILKVAKASDAAGSNAALDSLFSKWSTFAGEGPDIRDLAGAVKEVVNPHIPAGLQDTLDSLFSWIPGAAKNDLGQVRDRLKGLGDELGSLAKNGAGETAAKTFQALTKEFEKNGQGAREALDALPGYKAALQGLANQAGVNVEGQDLLDFAMGKVPASMQGAATATQTYTDATGASKPVTEEMAKALEDVGLSASGTVTNLAKFTEALLNTGLLQLSARDAARGWSQALLDLGLQADGTGGQIGVLGTEFDNTTAKGISNQEMFDGVAQAGIRNAEALAANGASQKDLQGNLTTTYNGLIAAAGQFGITGDEAVALTRKVLGVPPGVSIQSWMSSEAKRMAEATGAAADAVDGKTVNVYVNTHETTFQRVIRELSGDPAPKPPVGVLRKALGGRVYGPGTTTSDSIPHMLSKDEYVLKAAAAKKIGYDNLDRLNGGDTQPLRAGRQYAPASAPARSATPAAPLQTTVSAPAVTVMIGNEQLESRMYRVANTAISSADNQSQYTRTGRA